MILVANHRYSKATHMVAIVAFTTELTVIEMCLVLCVKGYVWPSIGCLADDGWRGITSVNKTPPNVYVPTFNSHHDQLNDIEAAQVHMHLQMNTYNTEYIYKGSFEKKNILWDIGTPVKYIM